jgi:hypothetical protein
MLSFVLSTAAFFVVAYFLNRHLDGMGLDHSMSRKILVGTVATIISIGSGWAIDKLDGDEAASAKNVPLADTLQSGDRVQILKALSGIK